MRIKVWALVLPLFLSSICAVGQEVVDVKAQINQIKKNTADYIYAEITATTEQDAKMLAEDLLYEEINKWAATQQNLQTSQKFLINNKNSCISTLSTVRGNMFRCFMYVRKSDIQKANNADLVDNTNLPSTTSTSQATHAVQPAEAKLSTTASTTQSAQPKPKGESTKAAQSATEGISETGSRSRYPQAVKSMATIRSYKDIIAKAQEYKASGEIVELVTNSFPENVEQYYLVIYDQQGRVQAILTPGMQRVNVCTGNDDSEKNYHGCKAFAFKVK